MEASVSRGVVGPPACKDGSDSQYIHMIDVEEIQSIQWFKVTVVLGHCVEVSAGLEGRSWT